MKKLYNYRFEIFFATQLLLLFGSIIIPGALFEKIVHPLLLLSNIAAGILLISKRKKIMWFFVLLFLSALIIFGSSLIFVSQSNSLEYLRMGIYFLFYTTITINIIKQVWGAEVVNKNVVIGLMSGYISLGLLGFFLFFAIEMTNPESFQGILLLEQNFNAKIDSLLYYSYITLLTVGYGEIIPVTSVAQKAAILIGLLGQFYIVIITAVIVEKYIVHSKA